MENIDLNDYRISNLVALSDNDINELNELATLTLATLNDAINATETLDVELVIFLDLMKDVLR